MSKCKFKVGDVVTPKQTLRDYEMSGNRLELGKKYTVTRIMEANNENEGYILTLDNGNTARVYQSRFDLAKTAKEQYKLKHFEKDIRTFNERCGNKVATKEMSLAEAIQVILPQAKVIREEANELLHACETENEQEILDGAVDTLVTSLRLISLLKERYDVMPACKDVMENNHLKYTEDSDKAADWLQVFGENNKLVKTTIDDKEYHCIKNEHGKIMKWDGFPKVDLSKYVSK